MGVRIELRVEGGFAGIRRRPLVLETSELEPAAARTVEALAAELPAGRPPARGADMMRYDVLVVSAGERRTEAYFEPDVPDPVRELLRLARETAGGQ